MQISCQLLAQNKDFRNSLSKCVHFPSAFSREGSCGVPREKSELISHKGQMEQGTHSLLEEAGAVGMRLSLQRDLCFLRSHGLVLAGSEYHTPSVYWTHRRVRPPASAPQWKGAHSSSVFHLGSEPGAV